MRTDLTSNFLAKMRADTASPRLLAVFHFADEDVYISDQPLGAAEGLSHEYEPLVEDWGALGDAGDPRDPMSSEIRQATITLWDGGTVPFSNYFLGQDPENVRVDVYQWFLDIPESGMALIDSFVCQDPIAATEASRLLAIDLVSLPMRYDGPCGDILTLATWPNAREEDIGRYLPIALGSPGKIPSLVARTAPKCTLDGSILAGTMTLRSFEDLDSQGFAQSGTLQIGEERMTYSARTDYVFTITQRGADNTLAVEHLSQAEIQQHVTDFTYLFCKGPISSFDAIYVGGLVAPVAIYTAYPSLDPARIVFTEKPYGEEFASASRFLEMQFDSVNEAVNTALQPYWAMDEAATTSAARISEDNPLLALIQATVNPNRGEIVKAYLAVEHWEGGAALQHDRVKVSISGVELGYLQRPNAYDTLELDAEVDIDHGHGHSISGEHQHVFTDPAIGTQESAHGHATNISEQTRRHASAQLSLSYNGEGSVSISGPPSFSSATLHCRTSPNYGCKVLLNGSWVLTGSGDSYIGVNVGAGSISLRFKNTQYLNGSMMIYEIWIDYIITSTIQPNVTGVAATILSSGRNAQDSDKAAVDVNNFASENRGIELNSSGLPTRSVVDLFDVSALVNYSWDWFTNKEVRLLYEGTVDNQVVYALHVWFDIEFRPVERVFSDDVTAEVVGLIDDDEGTYTGTPSAVITRPDHVRKYLLQARGNLPATNIDDASFVAAGARYTAKNYAFDGLIPGDTSVREAEKQLARECRSRWFWDAGKALTKFKENEADWTFDKELVQASAPIRLKGMGYERKAVSAIVNRVNLHYYRDWTSTKSGAEAYLSLSPRQDDASIALHGIRERADWFMFDRVRSAAMAADLAAYYLEEGRPSQFYTIEAFLPLMDLQKEDHIRLTHQFMNLQKAAMRIVGQERIFGSGKIKRMNLVRLVCESWYRILLIRKGDRITVGDICHIDFQFADQILNTIRVNDLMHFGFNPSDTVTVGEALAIVVTWVLTQTEAITCTESLTSHMDVALADTVTTREWLDSVIGHGFGLGSFGMDRFGSQSNLDMNPGEFSAVLEELTVVINAVLSDTITVTDAVLFSSGFGSPWASGEGFGAEPFGR